MRASRSNKFRRNCGRPAQPTEIACAHKRRGQPTRDERRAAAPRPDVMLFTSLDFFVFLPLVLAVFALTPVAQRWAVLLLASYVFYGYLHPFNLVYLGAVTLVIFGCGWGLDRATQKPMRVALLVLGLVAVLGSLTAFKFYDFIAGEIEHANLFANLKLPRLGITAPAGYSFYVFSAASYLIDIYGGRLSSKQNLGQ